MTSEELSGLPLDELVEIPTAIGKCHEPVIKGKGIPVWVLVSYAIHHSMTPQQISDMWDGYVTPRDVQAAITYAQTYPELVEDKLGDTGNGLGN